MEGREMAGKKICEARDDYGNDCEERAGHLGRHGYFSITGRWRTFTKAWVPERRRTAKKGERHG
jgi:hypothetical protein